MRIAPILAFLMIVYADSFAETRDFVSPLEVNAENARNHSIFVHSNESHCGPGTTLINLTVPMTFEGGSDPVANITFSKSGAIVVDTEVPVRLSSARFGFASICARNDLISSAAILLIYYLDEIAISMIYIREFGSVAAWPAWLPKTDGAP